MSLLITPSCFEHQCIHSVKNFDLLEKEIPNLDNNTLVIFDIDETLLTRKDKLLRTPLVTTKYAKMIPKDKFFPAFSRAFKEGKFELTNKKLPELIERIKSTSAKIIALTNVTSGSLGVIESYPDFRVRECAQFGFDFSNSFPHIKTLEIPTLQQTLNGKFPLFKNGIICTNGVSKETVLMAFLRKIKWKPKKVIFIDDLKEYVEKIADVMKKENIDFLGLHYVKHKDRSKDVNEKVSDIQFKYLIEKDIWLSDDEAAQLLESKQKEGNL